MENITKVSFVMTSPQNGLPLAVDSTVSGNDTYPLTSLNNNDDTYSSCFSYTSRE